MELSMIATLLLLQAAQSPVVGPEIPAGTNSQIKQQIIRIEEALEKKDWAGAERQIKLLPSTNVTLTWDDSKVPSERRAELAKARDRAIELWQEGAPQVKVSLAKNGRIKLSFAPSLPPNADSPEPAGAVYFFSDVPTEAAVEGVISLVRTEKRLSVEKLDITNEVGYAIGAYLGLERKPSYGAGAMARIETTNKLEFLVNTVEMQIVRRLNEIYVLLADYAKRKVQVTPAKPEIFLSQTEFRPEPVVQGDPLVMSLGVTNRGNTNLRYFVLPDCSCFALSFDNTVAPGQTKLVRIGIDTLHFVGDLDKTLTIQSNDPEMSVKKVRFLMKVEPLYRFLGIESNDVLNVDDGTQYSIYFVPNPAKSFTITGVDLQGVNGAVSFAPWEGSLPDRTLGEPNKPRKGYKIDFDLKGDMPAGRSGVTVTVRTTDAEWAQIRGIFSVQKGIVSLPMSVYFGEVGKDKAKAYTYLTRGGKPFKVLKVESDSPYVKGDVEQSKPGEYKLNIHYLGGADFGEFSAKIRVTTDDPNQPVIEVPIRAVVKG